MNIIGQNGNDGLHYEEEFDEDHALDQVLNEMVEEKKENNANKERYILKVLQQTSRQAQLLYSDGSTDWVNKKSIKDENIIRYF